MLIMTLIALQPVNPAGFGTKQITQPERCALGQASGEELVVCGRRPEQSPYRIGPQASTPPTLPNAEFKIANGVAAKLGADQGEIGGIPTNRAMFTLKIKF